MQTSIPFKRLALWAFIAMTIILMFSTAKAPAATVQSQQSLVGYGYTQHCVTAGQPARIFYVLKNQGLKPISVSVLNFGIAAAAAPTEKGPMIDVDTARSGLRPTASSTSWRWDFTLRPGQSIVKTLFISQVPPSFLTPKSDWNPLWGPRPLDRFYYGSPANVRHSTEMINLFVDPAYCA